MEKRVPDKEVSSFSNLDGTESMTFDPGGVLHAPRGEWSLDTSA